MLVVRLSFYDWSLIRVSTTFFKLQHFWNVVVITFPHASSSSLFWYFHLVEPFLLPHNVKISSFSSSCFACCKQALWERFRVVQALCWFYIINVVLAFRLEDDRKNRPCDYGFKCVKNMDKGIRDLEYGPAPLTTQCVAFVVALMK